jgi:cellulose biosynthesis protein BcsQ
MAKIVAVFNIKGGVGKTTSAVNLAYLSAQSGKKTLLWDMDHQGAAGFFLNIDETIKGGLKAAMKDMQQTPAKRQLMNKVLSTDYENLDLLPSDESFRLLDVQAAESSQPKKFIAKFLAPLIDHYDMIFIDCAPGLSLSNESLLHAVDLVLVPIIPTVLSVRTLEQLNLYIKNNMKEPPKLRGFFTMMDSRKNMHKDIYEHLCVKKKTIILPVAIPYTSITEKMSLRQMPLSAFAPSTPAAKAYDELWAAVKRMRL